MKPHKLATILVLMIMAGSGCASRKPAIEAPEDVCVRVISGIAAKAADQLRSVGREVVFYYQSSPGEGSRHRTLEKQLSVTKFASSVRWSLDVQNAVKSFKFDVDSGIASAHWIGRGDRGLVAILKVKFEKNGNWIPMEVHLHEQCIKTK